MANTDSHFRLRLPADLHERIVQEAQASERSINAEVVYRLRQSLSKSTSKLDQIDEHIDRLRLEISRIDVSIQHSQADRERFVTLLDEVIQLRKVAEEEAKQSVKDAE